MAKTSVKEEQQAKQIFWKRHINEWRKSGISQVQYCRQNKLSTQSFTYWKMRLSQRSSISFVAVQVKPEKQINAGNSAELVLLKDGYRIEIKEGFNPAALADVLRTIRELTC